MWLNVPGGIAENDPERTIDGLPVVGFPVAHQEFVNAFHGNLAPHAMCGPGGSSLMGVHGV
jgi:hypothetical protein